MRLLSTIDADLEQAKAAYERLREERSQTIIALSPHQVGDSFRRNGKTIKVVRITPHPTRQSVFVEYLFQINKGVNPVWSVSYRTFEANLMKQES